ncbi:MAG TPA: hypothetical protein VGL72_28740 [Bryobacteraceae bacterium]|jgi:hypothetical protein
MSRFHRTIAGCAALFAAIAAPTFGQNKGGLPRDHPELYYSYFLFIEGFGNWLDSQGAQAPGSQAKLMASAARYLKIDVRELPTLIATCRSVSANLRQIGEDSRRALADEAAAGKGRDLLALQVRADRRRAAIQDGISQLQQALSAAGWNAVHAHINGAHRASVGTQ